MNNLIKNGFYNKHFIPLLDMLLWNIISLKEKVIHINYFQIILINKICNFFKNFKLMIIVENGLKLLKKLNKI